MSSITSVSEIEAAAERILCTDPLQKLFEGDELFLSNFNHVGGMKGMVVLLAKITAISYLKRLNTTPYMQGKMQRRTMVDVNEQRKMLIIELGGTP